MCFSERKSAATFCAWICEQVSFVFHLDGIDLQAAYDEQQRTHDLTFLNLAFPSKFFACKRAKCFHKFVIQVLPVLTPTAVTAVHNTTLHHTVLAQSAKSVFLMYCKLK